LTHSNMTSPNTATAPQLPTGAEALRLFKLCAAAFHGNLQDHCNLALAVEKVASLVEKNEGEGGPSATLAEVIPMPHQANAKEGV